jgi:glycosyltransferase involved in cell wall biosynthesis
MSVPKLSIVIPCYNHGEYIKDAIASVERLPRELYELIIVNDGSSDAATNALMAELAAAGYHVIEQENKGLGAARNTGIAAAAGEYILPLDSDNKIRAEFTQNAVNVLNARPEIAIVHGDFQYYGDADFRSRIAPFDIKKMLYRNYIDACAIYRKAVWEDCGGYDTQMPVQGVEDWDFWLNAYSRGWRFLHLDEIAFDYMFRADSMLQNTKKEENWRQIEEYMSRKYAPLLKREFADYQTWDHHGRELRRRPFRTAFRLLTNAFAPKLHKRIFRKGDS